MTTTRYLEILAAQRPFPYGTDTNGRTYFSVNFRARSVGSVANLARDLISLIEGAGLGSFGSTLFVGQAAVLPTGDGPFVLVVDTGGGDPAETHNGRRDERLTFQIVVRSKDYEAGAARALAIRDLLDGQRDKDVAL